MKRFSLLLFLCCAACGHGLPIISDLEFDKVEVDIRIDNNMIIDEDEIFSSVVNMANSGCNLHHRYAVPVSTFFTATGSIRRYLFACVEQEYNPLVISNDVGSINIIVYSDDINIIDSQHEVYADILKNAREACGVHNRDPVETDVKRRDAESYKFKYEFIFDCE